ncbi:hypothetical protein [Methanosalsum natronophilum]|uniref:hypothetical protein n=1 Tax=Methanosalsum natronophilum TaxID=768733 RepID=UPI0021699DE3|nr:hypothetical protein [Methanosalsum natronophilum]MCS3923367.1 hypothetical protein [Methanosalsum natronophilum]
MKDKKFLKRRTFLDDLIFKYSKPEKTVHILKWAWVVSLVVMLIGFIIILYNIRNYIP